MQQEQDTCRICSGPGEPGQPLFYPCKCSGTIRYIHQDCLKTWLDHSKKSTCDVCKHPYAFTKVYAPDMPDRVPVTILVRKFAEQVVAVILFMLRATLVAFVWLTLLPYGTVLTWRLYFRMGDILAWWISMHPRPLSMALNATERMPRNRSAPFNSSTLLQRPLAEVSLQPYLHSLSTDIFTGQIIASLIVLAFLAVFLLREWIQQNARPGVFDDGPAADVQAQAEANADQANVGGDDAPAADVDPQWPPGLPEVVPALELAARAVPDVPEDVRPAGPSSSSSSDTESPSPVPAPAPEYEQPMPAFGRRRAPDVARRRAHRAAAMASQGEMRRRRRVLKGEREDGDVRESPSQRIKREEDQPARWESMEPSGSRRSGRSGLYALEGGPKSGKFYEQEEPGGSGNGSSGVSEFASKSGQKRKADDVQTNEDIDGSAERSLSPPSPSFEFTFQLPHLTPEQSSVFPPTFALPENGEFKLRPRDSDSSQSSSSSFSFVDIPRVAKPSSPQPLASSSTHHTYSNSSGSRSQVFELPPPELSNRGALAELPYPLTSQTSAASSTPQLPLVNASGSAPVSPVQFTFSSPFQPEASSSLEGQALRRPPLPTSALSAIDLAAIEASTSTGGTVAAAAMPSPQLAIYRPPEELEVENGEYFGAVAHAYPDEREVEEDEEEEEEDDGRFEYYFREPDHDEARHGPPPLIMPDTDDEEEEGPEGGAAAEPPVAVLPAARDPPNPEVDAEFADDERDQNLEEDLDGAMEAVGLRGPVFAVFQNAALMLFILNVSIGGGVWIPFTLGKTIALLTLEPRRAVQILHLPIRAVRFVTDPSVDAVLYALRLAGVSLVAWGIIVYVWALRTVGIVFGKAAQERLFDLSQRIDFRPILDVFTSAGDKGLATTQPGDASSSWITTSSEKILSYVQIVTHGVHSPVPSFVTSVSETPAFQLAEEKFANLGRHVRLLSTSGLKGWVDLAEGDGTVERLWAILLGYAIAAFLAALYLNTITVGNVRSAGRAVRNAIRQQMIVLKVALFIVVELVMFPFGCGTMLDFSTLVLFPEATVESRLAFFAYAPITAAFYHWLIGTMFMYQFAILLATCRDILRAGCMWFIKDPQDPTFHPIRDILDRPTFAQLRKLCMSAVMYAMVISLGVGSIVWGLTAMTPSILPLRWKMREPLSEIPVDLLFVHLILPPTLHYFRPRKAVRRLMTGWWQWAARQLRLTSFMFGGRHPSEEYTPINWSWRTILSNPEHEPVDMDTARDGSFRRAPAGDNIAFLRDKPALVRVDEHGVALDANGQAIILAQNAEAQQAGRNYEDDYTVVYVPPHFRRRIFLFILLFWISGSIATVSAAVVPILLGRAVFGLFTSRQVHDGYSLAIGFYLLWWGWLVGSLVVRIRIRRQRHEGSRRIRAGWLLFLFKRVFVYFAKIAWLVLWLGIVLPTLVSIAVDLYLVIPLRFSVNPDFTPTIHIFESWATGLVLSKIIIRTQRTRPGNDLIGALEAIQRNGWRRPAPWAATKDFIIPVGTGLIGMILLPPLALYGGSVVTALPRRMEDLFRFVYPSIFFGVAVSQFAMSLVGVFAKWTQGIRDKEFLVELRLRNLENPRKTEKVEPVEVDEDEDEMDRLDRD